MLRPLDLDKLTRIIGIYIFIYSNKFSAPPKLKPQAVPSQFTWNQKTEEKKEIKRKREQKALQHQNNRETGKNGSNKKLCEDPYVSNYVFSFIYQQKLF